MKTLRVGSRGTDVRRWQSFLLGQGFDPNGIDGKFGADTETATKAFQKSVDIAETGVVDNATLGAAVTGGFQVVDDDPSLQEGPGWPPIPDRAGIRSS
jgi:peptidoglycan hydrolase-like protein with peptidoglycan-binding domain